MAKKLDNSYKEVVKKTNPIKTVCSEQNITQKQLAEMIEYPPTNLSAFSSGSQKMSFSVAERINKLFPWYSIRWLRGESEFKTYEDSITGSTKALLIAFKEKVMCVEKIMLSSSIVICDLDGAPFSMLFDEYISLIDNYTLYVEFADKSGNPINKETMPQEPLSESGFFLFLRSCIKDRDAEIIYTIKNENTGNAVKLSASNLLEFMIETTSYISWKAFMLCESLRDMEVIKQWPESKNTATKAEN